MSAGDRAVERLPARGSPVDAPGGARRRAARPRNCGRRHAIRGGHAAGRCAEARMGPRRRRGAGWRACRDRRNFCGLCAPRAVPAGRFSHDSRHFAKRPRARAQARAPRGSPDPPRAAPHPALSGKNRISLSHGKAPVAPIRGGEASCHEADSRPSRSTAKPIRQNRRKHARVPVGLPVEVHISGLAAPLIVELMDIAPGGIRFRSLTDQVGARPGRDLQVSRRERRRMRGRRQGAARAVGGRVHRRAGAREPRLPRLRAVARGVGPVRAIRSRAPRRSRRAASDRRARRWSGTP